jgi:peroxiredoxin
VISSTDLEMTSFVAEALRAPYKILSDPEWAVFDRYGMGAVLGVPLPGVFIVDERGLLRYRWAAPASPVFRPPDTAAIVRELEAL